MAPATLAEPGSGQDAPLSLLYLISSPTGVPPAGPSPIYSFVCRWLRRRACDPGSVPPHAPGTLAGPQTSTRWGEMGPEAERRQVARLGHAAKHDDTGTLEPGSSDPPPGVSLQVRGE